jgi:hypothetical protein
VTEPTLRRKDDDSLVWREFEGEVLALDLGRSVYLRLNKSGALLWERLAPGATRTELIETLVGAFPVDAEQAATDVDDFLSSCRQRGLISEA